MHSFCQNMISLRLSFLGLKMVQKRKIESFTTLKPSYGILMPLGAVQGVWSSSYTPRPDRVKVLMPCRCIFQENLKWKGLKIISYCWWQKIHCVSFGQIINFRKENKVHTLHDICLHGFLAPIIATLNINLFLAWKNTHVIKCILMWCKHFHHKRSWICHFQLLDIVRGSSRNYFHAQEALESRVE